jgi:hypothetical protein
MARCTRVASRLLADRDEPVDEECRDDHERHLRQDGYDSDVRLGFGGHRGDAHSNGHPGQGQRRPRSPMIARIDERSGRTTHAELVREIEAHNYRYYVLDDPS